MKHTYSSAEKFILSREFFGMKLGLENITGFLQSIGSPQDKYRTIHLAGTNGKGSTAAMLASILRAAGYKTGLFTSPHLVSLRERVRVDGRMIPKGSVTAFIDHHRPVLSKRKISFFELIAAMAFSHFARVEVDVAVIETGLGGRLDATNVLNPSLTLTTEVSLDHTEILGSTIKQIAGEKAGIIKTGTPHVIGLLHADAERVVRERCRLQKTRFHKLTLRDFKADSDRGELSFKQNGHRLEGLKPGLAGPHQLDNAALAVKAITILNRSGMSISDRAVRDGIAAARFAGRFQVIRRPGNPVLALDVGHNATGVAAFVQSFRQRFGDRKARVITGFVKRKPHQEMVDALSAIASEFWLTPLKTGRSADLAEMMTRVDFGEIPTRRVGSLATAYRRVAKTSDSDDIIAIVGSHFLVGEFLERFGEK